MNNRYTAEDIARRGREIYEHHVRRKVEPEYDGKVLAIDVVTGEYSIRDNDLDPLDRAGAKNPDGLFHFVRVGRRAVHRIGGRFLLPFLKTMMHGRCRRQRGGDHLVSARRVRSGKSIEAVIDTGFTAYLTLPPDVVKSLSLLRRCRADFVLADDRVQTLAVYRVGLLWHARPRSVPVQEAVGTPLLGMEMLRGSEICIRVEDGGSVVIEELVNCGLVEIHAALRKALSPARKSCSCWYSKANW